MEQIKTVISDLQNDTIKVMQCMSRITMSKRLTDKNIDDYLCELENLCIKSRTVLEEYRPLDISRENIRTDEIVSEIAGSVEVTSEGWLHITLNTLLPNCKHRISGYIGDTIRRLLEYYDSDLPYFEKAFLGIVEYCNSENHNALDNDNKGWKMIPNALKGSVIEDDTQFDLSIGLFAKISEIVRCEIYVLPLNEASVFMEFLDNNTI